MVRMIEVKQRNRLQNIIVDVKRGSHASDDSAPP
jgi:hypothetical protein